MQSGSRKISRKELKEDQLITAYYKTTSFLSKHSKNAIIGAVILMLAVIIVVLIINSKKQANLAAGYETFLAQLSFEQQIYREAADISLQTIDKYSGTANAGQAVLLLGKAYFQMTDFDSAAYYARYYQKKFGKRGISYITAMMLEAAAYEQLEKYQQAAVKYLAATEDFPQSFTAPINLLDAGRCFNLAGDKQRAVEVYDRLIEQYPESNLVRRAQDQRARSTIIKHG